MKQELIFSNSFQDFFYEKRDSNKVCNILSRLSNKIYCQNNNILTADCVNYLTFRNNGNISYLPKGKEHKTTNTGAWSRENRQEGRAAKIIRKVFTDKAIKRLFKDSDFETFTNQYKSKYTDEGFEFKKVKGADIADIYRNATIKAGGGSLNGSCMNGKPKSYFEIYVKCKKLELLCLFNSLGELCGRSLIWQIGEDEFLMDRIYVTDDYMYDLFLEYAENEKYWRKLEYKSYYQKTIFIHPETGVTVERRIDIETDTEDFSDYPYIDTFTYGEYGYLNNHGGEFSYNNTDGQRDGENYEDDLIWCDLSRQNISPDSAVTLSENSNSRYAGYIVWEESVEYVNGGNYSGEYFLPSETVEITRPNGQCRTYFTGDDDVVFLESNEYAHVDDCVYCERSGGFWLMDECVELEYGHYEPEENCKLLDDGVTWCYEDDCKNVDGIYIHKDDHRLIEIGGDYYLTTDDMVTCLNDEYFLIDDQDYKAIKKHLRRQKRNKLGRQKRNKVGRQKRNKLGRR